MDRGLCRETYTFGTQFVVINISYLLSTPIAAYVFLPVFYRLQSASVYKSVNIMCVNFTRLINRICSGILNKGLGGLPDFWPRLPSLCR